MVYAIVRSGGQQHLVEPDRMIDVDRLHAEVGSTVELNDVLLVADGDTVIGQPSVAGASVVAEVVEHGRGAKILVFKYKSKTRYRRKMGHRQSYTRLAVKRILTNDEAARGVGRSKRGAASSGARGRSKAKDTKQDSAQGAGNLAVGEAQPDTTGQRSTKTGRATRSKKVSAKGAKNSPEATRKAAGRRTVPAKREQKGGLGDGP